jgi:hypothetical protein
MSLRQWEEIQEVLPCFGTAWIDQPEARPDPLRVSDFEMMNDAEKQSSLSAGNLCGCSASPQVNGCPGG